MDHVVSQKRIYKVGGSKSAASSNAGRQSAAMQIEAPKPNAVLVCGRTRVNVSGWAIADRSVAKVEVFLAGRSLGLASYGLFRADVGATFPQIEAADHSGYFLNTKVPGDFSAGRHVLAVVVTTGGGDVFHSKIEVEVVAQDQASIVPFSSAQNAGVASGRPLQLHVEQAHIDYAGTLRIAGWSVSLTPLTKIEVFVDDISLGPAEHGRERDDVAAFLGEYPNSSRAGFEFTSSVTQFCERGRRRIVKVRASAEGDISREAMIPLEFAPPLVPVSGAPGPAIQGHCDKVSLSSKGHLHLIGWAICQTEIESIRVLLGEAPVAMATTGLDRPDVGNSFPQFDHARRSGFECSERIPLQSIGERVVTLHITEKAGDVHHVQVPVAAIVDESDDSIPVTSVGDRDFRLFVDFPKLAGDVATEVIRGGLVISGWSLSKADIASVDVYLDDLFVGTAYYGMRREDIAAAFPDDERALLSGFGFSLPAKMLRDGQSNVRVLARDKDGGETIFSFRVNIEKDDDASTLGKLRQRLPQSEVDYKLRLLHRMQWRPLFRLLVSLPVRRTHWSKLDATLKSIAAQPYDNWCVEFLCASESQASAVRDYLKGRADSRIYVTIPKGTSQVPNSGGFDPGATGAVLLMLLSAGDELGADALLEFAISTGTDPDAALFYCDERKVDPSSGREDVFYKPQWSPDLLLSTNYLGRAWCARASLFEGAKLSIFNHLTRGVFDTVLRLTEATAKIRHIPLPLCRTNSEGRRVPGKEALRRALKRRGIRAAVENGIAPATFRIRRRIERSAKVSIIIPTCAARGLIRRCLETLRSNTKKHDIEIVIIDNIPSAEVDWKNWVRENADVVLDIPEAFNWSRFNNLAAFSASGEFLLFLNDDIEFLADDWLDVLLAEAVRPEVGAVGPQLLYPDGKVQHAGLFLTDGGHARHAFRFSPADEPGYFGLALTQRNVIGVTGACLLVRRAIFEQVGGFNEAHSVVNNDLDFCLKTVKNGFLNVYTPFCQLIHHELASRAKLNDDFDLSGFLAEWEDTFSRGDPYFHNRLSRVFDDYRPDLEPLEHIYAGYPLERPDAIKKIVVLKLDHIGDFVTAFPALQAIKHNFPHAELTVVAGRAARELAWLEPAIDHFIAFDFFHARSGLGQRELDASAMKVLQSELTEKSFDVAIDLRKHPDTRHMLKLTGARIKAGFDHRSEFPWLDIAPEWETDPRFFPKRTHVSDDLVNLVRAVAGACHAERAVVSPAVVEQLELQGRHLLASVGVEPPVVCIHPAAGTEMRQWPAKFFARLIDLLVLNHPVTVVLIGSRDEGEIAREILAHLRYPERVRSLVGEQPLRALPALLRSAALYVGNNSGPQHLAASLGVPTIGIHSGVVDAHEWGPLGSDALALQRNVSCSPCYLTKPEDCHRGLMCLRSIGPHDVYEACSPYLSGISVSIPESITRIEHIATT